MSMKTIGQTEDPKLFVKEWVQAHPEVKIVSQFMYDRYNDGERAEFNMLHNKIVYQDYLTKQDILLYEKSKITLPAEEVIDKQ